MSSCKKKSSLTYEQKQERKRWCEMTRKLVREERGGLAEAARRAEEKTGE